MEPNEKSSFYDQLEIKMSFCYLGDRLNPTSKSEVAVTARTRIGW